LLEVRRQLGGDVTRPVAVTQFFPLADRLVELGAQMG
jgi:hypothetical protein